MTAQNMLYCCQTPFGGLSSPSRRAVGLMTLYEKLSLVIAFLTLIVTLMK